MGTLLKNRRAGESGLAWNEPALAGPETLRLSSAAFAGGTPIPDVYTGRHATSPPLTWSAVPAGTAELLLAVEDVDAPMGKPFVHLLALVEPSVTMLDDGVLRPDAVVSGVRLLKSTTGRGYLGPAPIKGHGPHHYVFQLFALAGPALADGAETADSGPRAVLAAVRGPVLARGRLTGSYER